MYIIWLRLLIKSKYQVLTVFACQCPGNDFYSLRRHSEKEAYNAYIQ